MASNYLCFLETEKKAEKKTEKTFSGVLRHKSTTQVSHERVHRKRRLVERNLRGRTARAVQPRAASEDTTRAHLFPLTIISVFSNAQGILAETSTPLNESVTMNLSSK